MPQRLKQFVRPLAALAAITLIFGVAIYLYGRPDPTRADAEQYKVLSDYISSGLTGESHDLGGRDRLVVILERTTVSNMLVSKNRLNQYRALLATLPHAQHNLAIISRWTVFNFLVRNLRTEQLQKRLTIPAKYALATDAEIVNGFQQRFPGNYGYLTFTRIGFNRNLTEAIFYTEHVCGLCGEGKYVYMLKINGKWTVQGESATWIS